MPAVTLEELQIIINAINNASPELQRLERELKSVTGATTKSARSTSQLQKEVAKTRRETDRFTTSTRRLGSAWLNIKWDRVTRSLSYVHQVLMNTQRSLITLQYATDAWLNAIVGGLTAIGGAATFATAQLKNLEQAISTATTMFDRMGFEEAKKGVLDLAEKTGMAAEDIANALYMIGSAGYKASEAWDMLKVTMLAAIAGQTDPSAVFKGAVSTLQSFYRTAKDVKAALLEIYALQFEALRKGFFTYTEMVRDFGSIIPEAYRLGASYKEALAGYAALTLVLGNSAEAATATARAFEDMADKVENFEKAGIKLYDESTGRFRGLLAVLEDLREATKDMTDEQRTAFLTSLGLEIRAARGILIWMKNLDKLREIYKYLRGDIKALREAFEKQIESPGYRIARAQQRIIAALSRNVEAFARIFEKATNVIVQLIDWFARHGEHIWDLLMKLFQLLGPMVLKLKVFSLVVGDLFQMFFALLHLLHPLNILFGILGYIFLQMFLSNQDKIVGFFKVVVGWLVDLINWFYLLAKDPKTAMKILKDNLLAALDELSDVFKAVSKKIGETKLFQTIKRGFEYAGKFWEATKDALKKLAQAIADGFRGDVDEIIDEILKAIEEGDYTRAVGLAIGLAAQLTWKLIKQVWNWIVGTGKKTWCALKDFVAGVIEGFKGDIDTAVKQIEDAFKEGKVFKGVGLTVGLMLQVAWNMLKGVAWLAAELFKYLSRKIWDAIDLARSLIKNLKYSTPLAILLAIAWLTVRLVQDAIKWAKGVAQVVKQKIDEDWPTLAKELREKIQAIDEGREVDSIELAGLIIALTIKSGQVALKWMKDVFDRLGSLFSGATSVAELEQRRKEALKELQDYLNGRAKDMSAWEISVNIAALTIFLAVSPLAIAIQWSWERLKNALRIAWNNNMPTIKAQLTQQLAAVNSAFWVAVENAWNAAIADYQKKLKDKEAELKAKGDKLSDQEKKELLSWIEFYRKRIELARREAQIAHRHAEEAKKRAKGAEPDFNLTVDLMVSLAIRPIVVAVKMLKLVYDAAKLASEIMDKLNSVSNLEDVRNTVYTALAQKYPDMKVEGKQRYLPIDIGIGLAVSWHAVENVVQNLKTYLESYWESSKLKEAIDNLRRDLDTLRRKAVTDPESVTNEKLVAVLHLPVILTAAIADVANITAAVLRRATEIVQNMTVAITNLIDKAVKGLNQQTREKAQDAVMNAAQSFLQSMENLMLSVVKTLAASKDFVASLSAGLVIVISKAFASIKDIPAEIAKLVLNFGEVVLHIAGTLFTAKYLLNLIKKQVLGGGKRFVVKLGVPILLTFGAIDIAFMAAGILQKIKDIRERQVQKEIADLAAKLQATLERTGEEVVSLEDLQKLYQDAADEVGEKAKRLNFWQFIAQAVFEPGSMPSILLGTIPFYVSFKPQWEMIEDEIVKAINTTQTFFKVSWYAPRLAAALGEQAWDELTDMIVKGIDPKTFQETLYKRIDEAVRAGKLTPFEAEKIMQTWTYENIRQLGAFKYVATRSAFKYFGMRMKILGETLAKQLGPLTLSLAVNVTLQKVVAAVQKGEFKEELQNILKSLVIAALGAGATFMLSGNAVITTVTFQIVYTISMLFAGLESPEKALRNFKDKLESYRSLLTTAVAEENKELFNQTVENLRETALKAGAKAREALTKLVEQMAIAKRAGKEEEYKDLYNKFVTLSQLLIEVDNVLKALGDISFEKAAKGVDSLEQAITQLTSAIEDFANTIENTEVWYQAMQHAYTSYGIILPKRGPWAEGGFTGYGSKYEPAGIVHKGEYVIPKWMVEKYPELIAWLEGIRKRGYQEGGLGGGKPPVLIPKESVDKAIDEGATKLKELVTTLKDLYDTTESIADLISSIGADVKEEKTTFEELAGWSDTLKAILDSTTSIKKIVKEEADYYKAILYVVNKIIDKLAEQYKMPYKPFFNVLAELSKLLERWGIEIDAFTTAMSMAEIFGKAIENYLATLKISEKETPEQFIERAIRGINWEQLGIQFTEAEIRGIVARIARETELATGGKATTEEELEVLRLKTEQILKEVLVDKLRRYLEESPYKTIIGLVGKTGALWLEFTRSFFEFLRKVPATLGDVSRMPRMHYILGSEGVVRKLSAAEVTAKKVEFVEPTKLGKRPDDKRTAEMIGKAIAATIIGLSLRDISDDIETVLEENFTPFAHMLKETLSKFEATPSGITYKLGTSSFDVPGLDEKVKELSGAAEKAGIDVIEFFKELDELARKEKEEYRKAKEEAARERGKMIVEAIKTTYHVIESSIGAVGTAFSTLGTAFKPLKEIGSKIGRIFMEGLSGVLEIFMPLLRAVAGGVSGLIDVFTGFLTSASFWLRFIEILSSNLKNLQPLLDPIGTIIAKAAEIIAPLIDSGLKPFVDILNYLGRILGVLLLPILEPLVEILKMIALVVQLAVDLLTPFLFFLQVLMRNLSGPLTGILKLINYLIMQLHRAFVWFWRGLVNILDSLLGWIPVLGDSIKKAKEETMPDVYDYTAPEVETGYAASVTRQGPETVNIYQYIQNSNFFNSEEELKRFIISAVQEAFDNGTLVVP